MIRIGIVSYIIYIAILQTMDLLYNPGHFTNL